MVELNYNYNNRDCQHSDTYPHGNTEKCACCGAVYNVALMEWVKND